MSQEVKLRTVTVKKGSDEYIASLRARGWIVIDGRYRRLPFDLLLLWAGTGLWGLDLPDQFRALGALVGVAWFWTRWRLERRR